MKRRATADETSDAQPRATARCAARRPVTLASAVARNVYGFERRDLDRVRRTAGRAAGNDVRAGDSCAPGSGRGPARPRAGCGQRGDVGRDELPGSRRPWPASRDGCRRRPGRAVGDEPLLDLGRRSPASDAGSSRSSSRRPAWSSRHDRRADSTNASTAFERWSGRPAAGGSSRRGGSGRGPDEASVSATTPTKASVSRPWNVRGMEPAQAPRPAAAAGRPARSALGEGVADTADRQDERRRGGIVLDLVAQVADVDVDRLLVLVEGLVVAEQLEQLATGCRRGRVARRGGGGSRTRSASG